MKIEDFCYMHRGKQIAPLHLNECELIQSVAIHKTDKNRALLLLHGFSSSPAVYRYLIPELKHYDAIVCPLLAGHGESIAVFSRSKASDWLSTAQQACEHLIKEYHSVDVLGLSLGGLLACELSKQFKFNHLFLLAPALRLQININTALMLAQFLKTLGFSHLRNTAGNIVSTEHAEITYKKLPISAVIEILTLAQQYKEIIPNRPIDLFLGAYDQVVASEEVALLFANRPQVIIHRLKNSAHVLPLDNDLKEIIKCINSYH